MTEGSSGGLAAASDAEIEAALEHAHVPSLINALVHLTGDLSLIRGDIRPVSQLFGDPPGGVSPEDQAAMRARALEALKAHRDAGCPDLAVPATEVMQEMLHFIIGAELSPDYVEFLSSELKLVNEDPYRVDGFEDIPAETRKDFHVVVVGAGMSGLVNAIRLKQAGISWTIFDKNAGVGGTWFENRYPGCRVDSPNHTYSYSFAPNDWPQHFSQQSVLLDYFDRIASEYELRDHICLNTEVIAARYGDAGLWRGTVRGPDGERTVTANAIVTAVGQLNRPKLPDIPGRDDFEGIAFHTGQWEAEHDLKGKRIAVIGTGASAFQTVPEIAPEAESVTIFQRTPPWVAPRAEYHDYIPDGKHWLLNHVPFYGKWFRFWMFWTTSEGLLSSVRRDPAWNETDRSISPANDQLRELLTANVKAMVGDDAELLAKCVPDYPPAGKRMLVDNGHWFRALKRDNVELVTDPIARIVPDGIETESGRRVEADVILYGTGFYASRILFPMKIYGEGGVELREHWGADPRAYLGMVAPGFPNLFFCYGPNTNIVVNGSIIFFSECEVRYIMGCLKLLLTEGRAAMNCRPDVHDAYNEKIDEGNLAMAWGSPNVKSWYKNEHGRVTQNWPGTMLEFWQQSQAPNPDDFVLSGELQAGT
ncbi:MAG: NAD(P)/FAD-dependent oxidoreductase [Gammaproteobacteria bacterium]|nr:NAD(P)/FAD-dependent oxidoreductase [Gammaproteobacteria bacterium]